MSSSGRVVAFLLGVGGLALTGGLIYALFLLGSATLRTLAFIALIGGLVVTLVWAAQFPLRAWRSNQQPERHFYHDRVRETHHIPVPDTRLAPSLPQLPALSNSPVFPELLRAAFLAGQLQPPPPSGDVIDAEVEPWPESRPPAGWDV